MKDKDPRRFSWFQHGRRRKGWERRAGYTFTDLHVTGVVVAGFGDELAHRADLNRVYMGEVERGEKSVSIETIAKIAGGLKTKGGELLLKAGI